MVEDSGGVAEVAAEGGGCVVFLNADELKALTGFAQRARQIAQLRQMGIAFWVNGAGRPVVPRAVIEGSKAAPQPAKTWEPAWAGGQR